MCGQRIKGKDFHLLVSRVGLVQRYYTKLTCASYLVHISSFFDFFIIQCLKTLSDICGVEILAIEPPQLQHECNSQWAKLINFTQKVFKIYFLTLLVFKFTQYRYLDELFLIIHTYVCQILLNTNFHFSLFLQVSLNREHRREA